MRDPIALRNLRGILVGDRVRTCEEGGRSAHHVQREPQGSTSSLAREGGEVQHEKLTWSHDVLWRASHSEEQSISLIIYHDRNDDHWGSPSHVRVLREGANMSIWVITRSNQGIRGEADGVTFGFPHGVVVEARQQLTKSQKAENTHAKYHCSLRQTTAVSPTRSSRKVEVRDAHRS